MEITFETEKLKKQFSSLEAIDKSFGFYAKRVKQRIDEITDSRNLSILQSIRALSCQQLTANPEGQWLIKVEGNLSMIFSIDHSPIPLSNGSIDTTAVTKIRILGFIPV